MFVVMGMDVIYAFGALKAFNTQAEADAFIEEHRNSKEASLMGIIDYTVSEIENPMQGDMEWIFRRAIFLENQYEMGDVDEYYQALSKIGL